MSTTFPDMRTARIIALAAAMLSALTVSVSAGGYHGSHHPTPVPAVKSSYDPATSIIRDHRNRGAGNGTTSVPNGGQPK